MAFHSERIGLPEPRIPDGTNILPEQHQNASFVWLDDEKAKRHRPRGRLSGLHGLGRCIIEVVMFGKIFDEGNNEPAEADVDEISGLLGKLRKVGKKPDRDLLDGVKAFGQAAVRPLVELATDERLHNAESNSPEIWAPLHAIKLLGEIGAPEAMEPLLPLFDQVEDYSLAETLEEASAGSVLRL